MKKRKIPLLIVLVIIAVLVAAPARRNNDFGDYVKDYSFRIEINGVDAGRFASVDGFRINQAVIEYQNGDDPVVRKRPGRVRYGDLVLRKGYTTDSTLNDWIEATRITGEDVRKIVTVVLMDGPTGDEIRRWNCFECFPKSWKMSGLNSKGKGLITEELIIVMEWFEEVSPTRVRPSQTHDTIFTSPDQN